MNWETTLDSKVVYHILKMIAIKINKEKTATNQEIIKLTGYSPALISTTLNGLEDQKIIKREPYINEAGKKDRRKNTLTLNPKELLKRYLQHEKKYNQVSEQFHQINQKTPTTAEMPFYILFIAVAQQPYITSLRDNFKAIQSIVSETDEKLLKQKIAVFSNGDPEMIKALSPKYYIKVKEQNHFR